MSRKLEFVSPVIYDARGRAMSRMYSVGDYEATRNTRERTLFSGSYYRNQTETEQLPFTDRLKIIAYLRLAVRNNPVVAALCMRYATVIGSPSVHFNTLDGGVNNEKETAVEARLKTICHGTGWSWHRLHKIVSVEELIAGEVFAVKVGGKIQLIPAELCGSPAQPETNEVDGIFYGEEGEPTAYRFGVRVNYGGSNVSRISYAEEDGARIVDAEFVTHLGEPSRIEERRYSPRLSSVIGQIQNLDDIIRAKVTTVKNQSAMSLFFTKNFDPGLFAEASAMASAVEGNAGTLLAQTVARSAYQEIRNGQIMYGEAGEDVKLIEPNLNAQDFSQFALGLLDQICAPVGLFPEEVLVGYRNSSYSSARADRIRLGDTLKDLRRSREGFCDSVVSMILGVAIDSGEIQDASDGVADVSYGWPIIREIDEQKHVSGQAIALANGSKSLDQICAENGTFSDQVQTQVVRCATRSAKLVKAYSSYPSPTPEQVEAQSVTAAEIVAHMPNATAAAEAIRNAAVAEASIINADANAQRVENDGMAAGAAPVAGVVAPVIQRKPALIESIGIGGTQALIQVLQQVASGVLPREQGIATLSLLFGISAEEAGSMVPGKGTADVVEGAAAIAQA